ncbi:PadR family transcriptional regulator (plasmid) [Halorientalis pallida]|uniref:PadR family transcriptional regulator n=1 Tax=Halorientalis pallida TaxID=2479928 RepID=UPI003C6FD6EE
MDDLTAFQRDVLYVVAGLDEPHGLGIKAELDDYYEGEINHGRLYPNLDELTEKGLLEKGAHDQRTNSYTITDDGRQSIQRRRRWESMYVSHSDRPNTSSP